MTAPLSAKARVKAKWPDAVATFGTLNPLPSVLIWADSKNGPVIGRGVTASNDWVDAEINAWSDAASRIEAQEGGAEVSEIPEDLKALASSCAEQLQTDLPPEMSGYSAEIVYPLIERIATLESKLREKDYFTLYKSAKERVFELEQWKTEQLAVERTWDDQAVGRELGIPLGSAIRAQILPRIAALREENERLKHTTTLLQEAQENHAWWVKKANELEAELNDMRKPDEMPILKNLIAGMCRECAKGAPLEIEPSTGHYTHKLGGNYCNASFIHHEIADASRTQSSAPKIGQ